MRPAVFADLELAAALQRATAEGKLLLVDATAAWCGPCKMMDRTTWADPQVTSWLSEHAVAIQIDIDAQPELSRNLHIQAMPTIIAYRESKELDRVVGAKHPKEMLGWLDGLTRGETSLAVLKKSVHDEPQNVRARSNLARGLVLAGRDAEALLEYVWLWEYMLEHERSSYGVRLSFLAEEIAMLIKAHEPARTAFMVLRDRAAPSSGSIDREKFQDWTCLNRVLGEQQHTLAWYDALPSGERANLAPLMEHEIIPLLISAERWAEAGGLYKDPLATINHAADIVSRTSCRTLPEELIEYVRAHFRKEAANIVRALSAAHRTQDADMVTRRAREFDPSEEMAQALAGTS